ncbi:MAG: glycosyltransferase family 4 protein [Chlorobium sp.]|nr:glycosyltransferase family 4 protein [Chlorobium sp.]
MNIISFRPGVIGNNTAFECMAMIYKYLQKYHGYTFTIVKGEGDKYDDSAFRIVSIPDRLWRPIKHTPYFKPSLSRSRELEKLFEGADGVLTVDPTCYAQGLLAIRTANALHRPVWFDSSVTLMGTGHTIQWKIAKRVIRPLLQRVTGIIITVPKCIERFQDLALFSEQIADKFEVMGHPVDCSRFRPRPDEHPSDGRLRLLVVSRLMPEKGLLYILEAVEPLLRQDQRLLLQFLGTGPMKPLLVKEIHIRGLEGQVEFLPTVPYAELHVFMANADIFINHAVATSGWEEFFGAANIEAMACCLPAVLSNNGGITHVVRGDDVAFLVGERDISGLRRAVRQLVEDSGFRKEMGERARKYVQEHYDITVIAEKYRRMLETCK